jgi:hypothetical protein
MAWNQNVEPLSKPEQCVPNDRENVRMADPIVAQVFGNAIA